MSGVLADAIKYNDTCILDPIHRCLGFWDSVLISCFVFAFGGSRLTSRVVQREMRSYTPRPFRGPSTRADTPLSRRVYVQ